MSASMTVEQVEQEVAAIYIDTLGYLYCTQCYHDGTDRPCDRSLTVDGSCDRCGLNGEQSIEIVTGTATVEYPMCKIF